MPEDTWPFVQVRECHILNAQMELLMLRTETEQLPWTSRLECLFVPFEQEIRVGLPFFNYFMFIPQSNHCTTFLPCLL